MSLSRPNYVVPNWNYKIHSTLIRLSRPNSVVPNWNYKIHTALISLSRPNSVVPNWNYECVKSHTSYVTNPYQTLLFNFFHVSIATGAVYLSVIILGLADTVRTLSAQSIALTKELNISMLAYYMLKIHWRILLLIQEVHNSVDILTVSNYRTMLQYPWYIISICKNVPTLKTSFNKFWGLVSVPAFYRFDRFSAIGDKSLTSATCSVHYGKTWRTLPRKMSFHRHACTKH